MPRLLQEIPEFIKGLLTTIVFLNKGFLVPYCLGLDGIGGEYPLDFHDSGSQPKKSPRCEKSHLNLKPLNICHTR